MDSHTLGFLMFLWVMLGFLLFSGLVCWCPIKQSAALAVLWPVVALLFIVFVAPVEIFLVMRTWLRNRGL